MAINVTTDPRTRKQMILVDGKIEGVFFNELKNPKTYTGPKGQPWTPTHSLNIVVDGTRIGFGLTDKDKINAKDVDGNFHQLQKGVEISAEVEENGEYKGIKQYQSKASKVVVLDASGAVEQQAPKPQTGGSQSFSKGDKPGISVGHALNGAMIFYKDNPPSEEDLVKVAHKVHDVTVEVKKWYKENNPKMNEYDVGAASGNAVLNALKLGVAMDEVEQKAKDFLVSVVPQVMNYVVGEKKAEPVKKEPVKQAQVIEDEWSDSIPF